MAAGDTTTPTPAPADVRLLRVAAAAVEWVDAEPTLSSDHDFLRTHTHTPTISGGAYEGLDWTPDKKLSWCWQQARRFYDNGCRSKYNRNI